MLKAPAVLPRLAQPVVPDGGRGRGNYNSQPESLPPGSSDLVLVARDSLQPYRAPALLKPAGVDEAANYELVAGSGATSLCDPTWQCRSRNDCRSAENEGLPPPAGSCESRREGNGREGNRRLNAARLSQIWKDREAPFRLPAR